MSIVGATAAELLARMERGDTNSEEVTTAYLDVIAAHDEDVKAFVHVDREAALDAAREVDRQRQAGEKLGLLAGLPVAVKDIMCTRDVPTTCCSKMLANYVPPYDAHAVTLLRNAGAVLIGKTNMDEFAMGSSTEHSYFGATRNPWDLERAPGGSSGGSAAAVASQMAPLAVGTDTGGSIRQPAGFCGVVGMKPTYGRISRYGLVAFASSLDQIGPFASDTAGAALLLEAMSGYDNRDSTCIDTPVHPYSKTVEEPLAGLKIGVAKEHFVDGLDPEVETAINNALGVYESQGAELREISLPHSKYAVSVYYLIAPSEASSNLARYDGVHYGHRAESFENMIDMFSASRGEGFGHEVKRRVMLGTYALSAGYYDAYYLKALKVRRLIREDFDTAFQDVDVIVSPVSPTPAFKLGAHDDDPLGMYLSDIYTLSANLAGLPGISIPAGMSSDGLPIGLQVLAPPLEEDRVLRAARMFERETNWHTQRAPLAGQSS